MLIQPSDAEITLPFIVRGQQFDSKEILHISRDGKIQFRYPDPRSLFNKIVLHDPVQLQHDFAGVRVSEIIDFLAEAGRFMTLRNERMQTAYRFSLLCSDKCRFSSKASHLQEQDNRIVYRRRRSSHPDLSL